MDMGYFVAYNMRVLQQSFKQLQDYIKRKQEEKRAANSFCALVTLMLVKLKSSRCLPMIPIWWLRLLICKLSFGKPYYSKSRCRRFDEYGTFIRNLLQ